MANFYYDCPAGRVSIEVFESVYPPDEDSMLLADAVEKKADSMKGKNVLEMGCGSGFISILVSKLTGNEVYAADVNPIAVENTRLNSNANGASVKAIESDLFRNVEEKFDFIIFNAPYLPEDESKIPEIQKRQWSVLFEGRNVIEEFLKQAKEHLEGDGKIIMLFSSVSGDVNEISQRNGFNIKIISGKKLDFEELFVGELAKRN